MYIQNQKKRNKQKINITVMCSSCSLQFVCQIRSSCKPAKAPAE